MTVATAAIASGPTTSPAPTSAPQLPVVTSWERNCLFPGCTQRKVAGRDVCTLHIRVRISSTGSWVNDRHESGGHG